MAETKFAWGFHCGQIFLHKLVWFDNTLTTHSFLWELIRLSCCFRGAKFHERLKLRRIWILLGEIATPWGFLRLRGGSMSGFTSWELIFGEYFLCGLRWFIWPCVWDGMILKITLGMLKMAQKTLWLEFVTIFAATRHTKTMSTRWKCL